MTITERIRELCNKKGISMTILEKELGYGNGSLTKTDGQTMKIDRLIQIADYFHVTIEYLATGKADALDQTLMRSDAEMSHRLIQEKNKEFCYNLVQEESDKTSKYAKAILESFDSAPPNIQKAILSMLNIEEFDQ